MLEVNKNFVFVHYPKTGGTFVRGILDRYAKTKEIAGSHNWHSPLHDAKKNYKMAFSTVRNPVDFYASVWKFLVDFLKSNKSIESNNPLHEYSLLWDRDFNKFIENVLKEAPGIYSDRHAEFVGNAYVIKTELLNYELAIIMSMMDLNFDGHDVLASGKAGERNKVCRWDKDLKKEIIKSEWDLITRYYLEL